MFYTRYFPGWTATLDGAPAAIAPYGAQGLIALDVPAGTHTVTTHFGTTRARTIGALVSCLALLAALVFSGARVRRVRERRSELQWAFKIAQDASYTIAVPNLYLVWNEFWYNGLLDFSGTVVLYLEIAELSIQDLE